MSTPPPEEGPDKPSALDQAKSDGVQAAAEIARGAAIGGAAGAVKGAAAAVVKTKTGRKTIGAVVAIALVPVIAAGAVFSSLAGGSATGPLQAQQVAITEQTAAADIADEETMRILKNSATSTGIPWEVLTATWLVQSSSTLREGTGPFRIDVEAAEGEISEADAMDLEQSALFVGRRLSDAGSTTFRALPEGYALDTGSETYTDSSGQILRRMSEEKNAAAQAQQIEDAFTDAIAGLPLFGNPDIAKSVFTTARDWSLGIQQQCLAGSTNVELGGSTTLKLTDEQLKNAQAIINAVAKRKLPQHAAIVALATALQESSLINVNYGDEGDGVTNPDGSPTTSKGLFQQQDSWGSLEQRMDPEQATGLFLDVLVKVDGWEDMAVTDAAQAVQRSGFPGHYAKWEGQARQLVSDLKPTGGGGYTDPHDGTGDHAEEAGDDTGGDHLRVNPEIHKNAQAVEMAVIDNFASDVSALGDYRDSSDDHGVGRGVDIMIRNYGMPNGVAAGTKIAQYFIDNAEAFGIDYLIWDDKIWLGKTIGWKPYSTGGYGSMYTGNWNDTTLHKDHVHVSVVEKEASGEYTYVPPGDDGGDACGGGTAGSATGSAGKGDDYPYKNPGECAWCLGSTDPGVDPWSLYKRECVSFVAWRMNQQMGWKAGDEYPFTPAKLGLSLFGNAAEWKDNLAKAGYKTDNNPKPGSIAWWGANGGAGIGTAGHVAVVTEVHGDGTVTIEEYNVNPWAYGTRTIPASSVNGFIHVADTEK